MARQTTDERNVKDQSAPLFEEMGTVRMWPFSESERDRVLSAVPDLKAESVPWEDLAQIRSIFDDFASSGATLFFQITFYVAAGFAGFGAFQLRTGE